MSDKHGLAFRTHNPDVLNCLANLSSDEIFTPPEFAGKMLDLVAEAWAESHGGANLWADPSVRFLDPFTKSGVFLREITSRLVEGLAESIPDLTERVDHILTTQVFGIGITRLTSLVARRSLYCTKHANGKHSIAKSLNTESGNIWFETTKHSWDSKKSTCRHCGASRVVMDRDSSLETHAYAFIHTDDIRSRIAEIFGEEMQFDVIIGNPPYQLKDGGHGASAAPIYHLFVEQAKKLNPRFLSMVIPSRWFSGGKGLDRFRETMLADNRIEKIVDYIVDSDAIPGINANGGVNYFLWSREHGGNCEVTTVAPGGVMTEPKVRSLDEFDVFIRRNEAVSILRKVRAKKEPTFDSRVSSHKPFGLRTNFHGAPVKTPRRPIKLHGSGKVSWVSLDEVPSNQDWVDEWKVLVPRATDGNEKYPLPVWDKKGPFVSGTGEACSETYLIASLARSEYEAENIAIFMRTRFFRFMVSLRKITQDNKSAVFSYVPDLPMDRGWSDEMLYARYGLTKKEISFIESMIRPMELNDV